MSTVIITEGKNSLRSLLHKLHLHEFLEEKEVESILIKPNLLAGGQKKAKRCSFTRPELIRELSGLLLDMGYGVSIGESTPSKVVTKNAFLYTKLQELEDMGVHIYNFNTCKSVKVEVGGKLQWVKIPEPVLNTDFLVSLPILKTHLLTSVTLSLKNMIGAIHPCSANRMHYFGLNESIALLNTVIKPDLAIVDAFYAMEGTGPVFGQEVELNTLIGGYDPVAVDAVGTRLIGFDPCKVEHICLAAEKGLGEISSYDIVGEFQPVQFLRPEEDGLNDVWEKKVRSSQWFHFFMQNPMLHALTFDYFYYAFKYLRNKFFIGREVRKLEKLQK